MDSARGKPRKSGAGTLARLAAWLPALCLLALLAAPALAQKTAPPPPAPPRSITVVSDDNYPPYVFRGADGAIEGILPDLWRAWEEATGVRVAFVALPWAQAQERMRSGQADVIDTIFQNPERERIYDFTRGYAHIEVPVFVHKSLGGIRDVTSLRGFTVGVKAGDAVIGELNRAGIYSLKEFAGYHEVIEAAKAGEIRVFSVDTPPALYHLYRENLASEFRKAFVLYSGEFHRAVRKGDADLLRLVERGFDAVPKARRRAIEERWLGQPLISTQGMNDMLLVLGGIGALLLALGFFNLALRRRVRVKTDEVQGMMAALRQSEERFRAIFNAASDAIFIHSWPDGAILDVNERACEMFGYGREELLRLSVEDISAGGASFDQAHAQKLMSRAHGGEPQLADWQAKGRDGRLFWVEVSIRQATIIGQDRVLVSCRDITGRKEAEEALARERQFTDAVIDSVPGLLYLYDDEGRLLRWNRTHETLTGYGPEELAQMRLFDWYRDDPDTIERISRAIQRVLAEGSGAEEAELQTKDGRRIPFYFTAVRLELGGKIYFTGVGIDISERRRAEQELAAKEALLQAMVHNLPFDFWARDTEQRLIMQSQESVRIWGDLTRPLPATELINTRYMPRWSDVNRRALAGEVVESEERYVITTGEERLFHAIVAPIMKDGRALGIMGINIDITGRERAEVALRESRRVLSSVLNTVPQSIFWKDRESVYLGCNAAFAVSLGLSGPEAVVGKTDFDLPVKREEAEAFRADDRQVMQSRQEKRSFVESLTLDDGRQAWLQTSKLPLLDDSGRAEGVLGVFEDITERKAAEEQLVLSKRAADAANRAKSEFLANMSHEIRTPLNGVLGMIELLKSSALGQQQHECVERADEAARRLLSLLNDILDFSRIEAGRMVLGSAPFALPDVFRTVSNVLDATARKKGLALELVIDPSVPGVLVGDDARLRQVLFNLVGNAIKFTHAGRVRVDAWRIPRVDPPGRLRLCLRVSDTGVGIAPENVRHVFERFTQSDASYARQYEGAGLGLAIVKRIVDLMDGELTVDSAEGEGTDIYLSVDMAVSDAPAPQERPAGLDLGKLPPLRILLAEDEPIGQMAMRLQLERGGHTVTAVANGREALDALAAHRFDCVLMDIQMPVMDGVEATRRIRSYPEFADKSRIPIIALTAYVMEGDRERFLAAGMDGHVGKPVQPEVLAQTLAEVVLGRRSE